MKDFRMNGLIATCEGCGKPVIGCACLGRSMEIAAAHGGNKAGDDSRAAHGSAAKVAAAFAFISLANEVLKDSRRMTPEENKAAAEAIWNESTQPPNAALTDAGVEPCSKRAEKAE